MIGCAIDGELAEATRIHHELAPLVAALFATTSPIPLKYALARCGFACGGLRLPLIDIDPKSAEVMDAALARTHIDLNDGGKLIRADQSSQLDALAREGYAFYAAESEEFATASIGAVSEALRNDR
jgi:hypothetical protein